MSVVPSFSNFGKTSIFQLYDRDTLDNKVRVVQKSSGKESLNVDASLIYADKSGGKPRGELKANAIKTCGPLKGAVVDVVLQTDSAKASSIGLKAKNVFPVRLPGFNVSVKETTSEKDFSAAAKYGLFGTVEADYSRPNFTATTAITTDGDSNHSVSASAAVGFEGFTVGGDVKFLKSGEKAFAPKSYNAGISYRHGSYTGALVTDSMFDKVKVSLLAKQPNGCPNWQEVGLQGKFDLPTGAGKSLQREITFGARYQATPNTFYNAAVVLNSGNGVFGVEHRLAEPKMMVTAAAKFERPATLLAPWPCPRFGVGVTFGEF